MADVKDSKGKSYFISDARAQYIPKAVDDKVNNSKANKEYQAAKKALDDKVKLEKQAAEEVRKIKAREEELMMRHKMALDQQSALEKKKNLTKEEQDTLKVLRATTAATKSELANIQAAKVQATAAHNAAVSEQFAASQAVADKQIALEKKKTQVQDKLVKGLANSQTDYYKGLSRQAKAAYREEELAAKKARQAELESLKQAQGGKLTKKQQTELDGLSNDIKQADARKEKLAKFEQDQKSKNKAEQEAKQRKLTKANLLTGDVEGAAGNARKVANESKAKHDQAKANLEEKKNKLETANIAVEQQDTAVSDAKKELAEAKLAKQRGDAGAAEAIKRAEEKLKLAEADKAEAEAAAAEAAQEVSEAEQEVKDTGAQAKKDDENAKILERLSDTINKLAGAIDDAITVAGQYSSVINTRLQGTDTTYKSISKILASQLGTSPFVQQKQVLESIKKLTDAGVAYNIEQRAYLDSLSDKIATTFEANNATLLRLIRLQQADSTAARLGMEASLTKMLNKMFEDTSYLTNGFDSVSAAIIDANSQLSRNQSLAFEYAIQKWLGALSSLGISDTAITNIATAINYLGSGNVQALAQNEQMQTLLAMSAAKSDQSYAAMLTAGLNAETTNELLKSMVEYLQEVSISDNKVVKSAYSDLFGMTVADFRAISSLTEKDISKIYKDSISFAEAELETSLQMLQIPLRMHASEMIDNVYQNFLFTIGNKLAANPALSLGWKINNLVQENTGGINIPFVNAAGFGLDLNANINSIAKLAMVGVSTVAAIPDLIRSVVNIGDVTLNGWKSKDYTSRGEGFEGVQDGLRTELMFAMSNYSNANTDAVNNQTDVLSNSYEESIRLLSSSVPNTVQLEVTPESGTSYSSYVSSAGSDDIYNSTIASATKNIDEISKILNSEVVDSEGSTKTAGDIYQYIADRNAVAVELVGGSIKLDHEVIIETEPATLVATLDEDYIKTVNSIYKYLTENNTLNVNVMNETATTAFVESIKNEVIKAIANSAKEVINNSSNTTTNNVSSYSGVYSQTGDQQTQGSGNQNNYGNQYEMPSIADLINKLVNGVIDVNVTNNNFDNLIDKYSFMGD